jgi:hypothetical protein
LTQLDAFSGTDFYALATEHNVEVFPIVIGTSSKLLKNSVTGYSSFEINLKPFTLEQTLRLIAANTGVEVEQLKTPQLLRLIKSLGGIPRFISLACQFITSWLKGIARFLLFEIHN